MLFWLPIDVVADAFAPEPVRAHTFGGTDARDSACAGFTRLSHSATAIS
jgi:hypothetical protein